MALWVKHRQYNDYLRLFNIHSDQTTLTPFLRFTVLLFLILDHLIPVYTFQSSITVPFDRSVIRIKFALYIKVITPKSYGLFNPSKLIFVPALLSYIITADTATSTISFHITWKCVLLIYEYLFKH